MKYDDEYYKAELKYYRDNRSELMKKYRGQLIAISREGVICHGWGECELMRGIEKFPFRKYIIVNCGDDFIEEKLELGGIEFELLGEYYYNEDNNCRM